MSKGPVTRADLVVWLRRASTISIVVLVALFTQRSQGHSSVELLIILAVGCAGTYLLTGLAFKIRYWGRRHEHVLARFFNSSWSDPILVVGGICLLLTSLIRLDTGSPDYVPPPSVAGPAGTSWSTPRAGLWFEERVKDTDSVAVRGLQVARNERYTRIAVSIINRTERVVILDGQSFTFGNPVTVTVCSGGPGEWTFVLGDELVLTANRTTTASATLGSGPLAGFAVKVRAEYTEDCFARASLEVEAGAAIAIDAHGTTTLALDVPRAVRAPARVRLCFSLPIILEVAVRDSSAPENWARIEQHLGVPEDQFLGHNSPLAC